MGDRPRDLVGLDWQPVRRDELAQLSALLTAIEHLDAPGARHSFAELEEAYDSIDCDPELDTIIGRDPGGTLVAYGWNHRLETDVDPRRVHLAGGVHPGWRRHGVGTAVLEWQLARARRSYLASWRSGFGPLRPFCVVEDKQTEQRALYERAGLEPMRWFADLTMTFTSSPAEVEPIRGVRIVPMRTEHLEPVRQAHNEAFADHWGTQPVDQQHWAEQLGRASTRLSWSWVALDAQTSEVVGYATNSAHEQDWEAQGFSEGWTDRLGVKRGWRGRGIAKALLAHSMHSFAAAGLDAAGLGVDTDSPSKAFALYQRLGYQVITTMVLYGRDLPHGT